jgi:hypothetical protein
LKKRSKLSLLGDRLSKRRESKVFENEKNEKTRRSGTLAPGMDAHEGQGRRGGGTDRDLNALAFACGALAVVELLRWAK